MAEKTVQVPKMMCDHCVATLEREIGSLAGVETASPRLADKLLRVVWREGETGWEAIEARLREIGYPPA
jgi:copper chaperone CopZ